MKLAVIKEIHIKDSLDHIVKRLKYNLDKLDWEIEHTEDLRTISGEVVKIFFGNSSSFGGATFMSVLANGGGHVPYYIKLTEINEKEINIIVAITGSERIDGDYDGRREKVAKKLLEMCECDYRDKTLKEKVKRFFA